MKRHSRPNYTDKNSTQTLQEGLEEYYAINPEITDPRELPPAFAKILIAHDVSHVILGCDTDMYDELKILPLSFWTSDFKFSDYIRTRKDPKIKPAIDIMYDDLIKQHGILWLYSSILLVLPRLLPEIIKIWWQTRGREKFYPFLESEAWRDYPSGTLRDRSLLEIRQEYDLFSIDLWGNKRE
ncbi:MAG: hypothetical protein ACRC2S_08660 [Waterburya sp.]